MADTLSDIKQTGQSLMNATGVPQIAKAATALGEGAVAAKDYAGKKLGQATDYVKNLASPATPAKRTTDIDLPKDQKSKRSLSRGRR